MLYGMQVVCLTAQCDNAQFTFSRPAFMLVSFVFEMTNRQRPCKHVCLTSQLRIIKHSSYALMLCISVTRLNYTSV